MEIRYGSILGDILGIVLMINHLWIAIVVLCVIDILLLWITKENCEVFFGIFMGIVVGALLIIIMDYFGVDDKSSGIATLLILEVMSIVLVRS